MKDPKIIIDSDVTQITSRYSKIKGISPNEALALFLGSKTYKTLNNIDTGLCYEMTDYIYEMFLEETGDLNELQTNN
jgi:hypothetical protein